MWLWTQGLLPLHTPPPPLHSTSICPAVSDVFASCRVAAVSVAMKTGAVALAYTPPPFAKHLTCPVVSFRVSLVCSRTQGRHSTTCQVLCKGVYVYARATAPVSIATLIAALCMRRICCLEGDTYTWGPRLQMVGDLWSKLPGPPSNRHE